MNNRFSEEVVQAVELAVRAELEAKAFYEKAAKETKDARGRDMFTQLAAFEDSHYRRLKDLLVLKDDFPGYKGTAFSAFKPGVPPAGQASQSLETDIDALALAIDSEKKAQAAYLNLAKMARGTDAVDFFKKLADEEGLHKKVLEDQFFALGNKGYWTWGE